MTGLDEELYPGPDIDRERRRLLALIEEGGQDGPFRPDWSSLRTSGVPDWLRDAKLGIFIHWLVTSVPAFGDEWYPRNMYVVGTPEHRHHLATYGPPAEFGFARFIADFHGSQFDADEWMQLVARSGARYVVPVAEHHDGFALYDSALTRWKSTLRGPRRDVIGELAAAARRQGIAFGVSNHRAEHWWFFNGWRKIARNADNPVDDDLYGPAMPVDSVPDDAFLDDWSARLAEVVERHDPEIVYFDWWIEQPAFRSRLAQFAAYYYNRAARRGLRAPVINYKWEAFEKGSAVYDIERGTAQGIEPEFFQTDTSASRLAWGHLHENVYKTASDVIGELIDVVSKNGGILLNIGPRPDGTIPAEERAVLEGLGDWMSVNSEAIYGTRPWHVFGEGPTQPRLGSFSDSEPTPWTREDIRFTAKGDVLYAATFVDPGPSLLVRSLGTSLRITGQGVRAVSVLGRGAVNWSQDAEGLRVELGRRTDASPAPVLRIELDPWQPVTRFEPAFPD